VKSSMSLRLEQVKASLERFTIHIAIASAFRFNTLCWFIRTVVIPATPL
jgi:hypothetical protein